MDKNLPLAIVIGSTREGRFGSTVARGFAAALDLAPAAAVLADGRTALRLSERRDLSLAKRSRSPPLVGRPPCHATRRTRWNAGGRARR